MMLVPICQRRRVSLRWQQSTNLDSAATYLAHCNVSHYGANEGGVESCRGDEAGTVAARQPVISRPN